MLNTDKEIKLYYSIGEVDYKFGVKQSLLRFHRSLPKQREEGYASIAKKMWRQSD